MPTNDEVSAFADRFIDALNVGDADLVRGFYQPDATVWHNFDNADQALPENLKLLEWMVRKARNGAIACCAARSSRAAGSSSTSSRPRTRADAR